MTGHHLRLRDRHPVTSASNAKKQTESSLLSTALREKSTGLSLVISVPGTVNISKRTL